MTFSFRRLRADPIRDPCGRPARTAPGLGEGAGRARVLIRWTGPAVAAGDIDGRADPAAGAPGENAPAGRLYLPYGSRAGITVKGVRNLGPADLGIGGRQAGLGGHLG